MTLNSTRNSGRTTTNFDLHEELPGGPLQHLDIGLLSKAMRAVTVAITDAHTADCLIYAYVGAAVLRELGIGEARAVAGSALWRVGSGDGDVIAHALELQDSQTYTVNLSGQNLAIHAWIALPDGHILDFTTWTLRDKAKALDALDGGQTSVEWAPDFLHTAAESVVSIMEVRMAPCAGVFSYIRHPHLEAAIQTVVPRPNDVHRLASAVRFAYNRLLRGGDLNVIGVREDGRLQTETPRCSVVELA